MDKIKTPDDFLPAFFVYPILPCFVCTLFCTLRKLCFSSTRSTRIWFHPSQDQTLDHGVVWVLVEVIVVFTAKVSDDVDKRIVLGVELSPSLEQESPATSPP